MKTLNQMLDGYKPKAGDEQKFKDKHVIVKSKLSKPTENEAQFTAPAVKPHARGPRHGYDQGKDEEVYEAAEQTPPFELSKSTFKKAKNPNRTPMDSAKALAQKGMKTKTNEEVVAENVDLKIKKYAQHQKHAFDYYDMGNDKKSDYHSKKAEEILNHINKEHGSKAAQRAEKAGEDAITGTHIKLSGPARTYLLGRKKKIKEEVEALDEKLKASDSTSTWIHDFVHSKNKKFAGKSKDQRINMALGAKYAKEDFDFSEEEQAPLFERRSSLNKLIEAAYKRQPVGVKIHYTHPEKKATWAQHFSAQDAASGEKEMAAQGYKVKKRELMYGKVGV